MSHTPWRIFLPDDIDCFSSCDIFSPSAGISVTVSNRLNILIACPLIRSHIRVLDQDIITSQLLSGKIIDLRLTILKTAVFLCIFIIYKPWMIYREIIKMHLLCGRSLRKRILCSVRHKHIMAVIIFFILSAVSHLINSLLQQVICRIGIVWSLTVCTSEIARFSYFNTIQIINQMLFKIRKCKSGLTIMCIDRIKLIRIKNIIISAASDGTDPFQIFIILKNSHQSCDIALYRCLIYNTGIRDSTLRASLFNIVQHHRYRADSAF